MKQGANYKVYIVEFCKYYNGGSYTYEYYFNGKDAAVKYAEKEAKKRGCGALEPSTVDATFGIQATGNGYWVGVIEITTMD